MGALGSAHLTVSQVSCMINGIHIGARYLAACVTKAAVAVTAVVVAVAVVVSYITTTTTARVFTSPHGRILFGQRQRWCRKEL